jgi:hypothetical protein
MMASQPAFSAAIAWARAVVPLSPPTLMKTAPRPAENSTSCSASRARSSAERRTISETMPVPRPSAPMEKIQSISRRRSAA